MTRSVTEANSAVSRIRQMPYGVARSTAAAAELDTITAEGPPESRAYALFATLEGYVWGGEVDKAFLPFTQMLRWWDTHPEHFDDQDQHSLFWSFKWMVSHLMEFPTISATQIDATLADMHRRYALAGNGMNAVAMSTFGWAQMRGAPEAEQLFTEWTATPRDDFSQCEACDPGDRAAHLYLTGRYDECIDLIEATLRDRPSCATEPGDMLSFLQLAYLHTGNDLAAARSHRAAMQHLPTELSAVAIRGRHLEFLARSGNHTQALARLAEDQRLLTDADTPYERWLYLRAVGAATGVLRAEHSTRPIDLREVPATTVAELDEWARRTALQIAAEFDARNGSTTITDRTWEVWNDTSTLPVDLSVFGQSGDPTPSPVHDPEVAVSGVGARLSGGEGSPACDAPPAPAALVARAEELTASDPAHAARTYAHAAQAYRDQGRLDQAGFAHAEAAMCASAAGDNEGANAQFASAVSLLRGAGTPARFVGPVVRAWARRAPKDLLSTLVDVVEALEMELAAATVDPDVAANLADREQSQSDREARRLRDTRARIAATLGDPSAASRAESVAEEFARAGEFSDAAYAFWLLGSLHPDGPDAVYALESAVEGFGLARARDARRASGNELVGLLQRLGRAEDAQALAASLSDNP